MSMTIDEALRKVKRLKGDLAEYKKRVTAAAKYKEGDEPAFGYEESYKAYQDAMADLIDLRSRIAEANATHLFQDGSTLTHAVTALAEIKAEVALFQSLTVNVQPKKVETERTYDYDDDGKRVGRDVTTVWVSSITQAQVAEKIKTLQNRFDTLNAKVEKANRETNLPEDEIPPTQA